LPGIRGRWSVFGSFAALLKYAMLTDKHGKSRAMESECLA
jgi:hypothetical protein